MSRIISTRRQVVTEEDRYGGYRMRDDSADLVQERAFDEPAHQSSGRTGRSFGYGRRETAKEADLHIEVEEPVVYSGRDYSSDIGLVPASKFAKPRQTPEQMMPRIEDPEEKRAFFHKQEQKRQPEPRSVQREKTSMSAKMALFVYAAAILLLTAVVVGTGIAINGADKRIEALETERATVVQMVVHQQNELSRSITEADAKELNMEGIDSYTEIEVIELSAPITYTAPTNWFDRFVDWVSSLFH